METTIYVAKYSTVYKLFLVFVLLAGVGLFSIVIIRTPDEIAAWHWIFLLAYFGLGVGCLISEAVRRVWVTERGIYERNGIGRIRFMPFGKISKIEFLENRTLIKSPDGFRIQVSHYESEAEKLVSVLNPYLDSSVEFEDFR